MRWLFDMYLPFAKRGQRELRSPFARFFTAMLSFLGAAWLFWLVVRTYLEQPTDEVGALLWLAVPVMGALYLLYVVYLVLLADGRRVRRGLIAAPYLRLLGVILIPHGFWLLAHGRLDGAISIVAGLACLGVSKQRREWFFGDDL